jgi:hypothetical protein
MAGFCVACHGQDGRDDRCDPPRQAVATDFTQAAWRAARTDGELLILPWQPGCDGGVIPTVLTEEEAWQVMRFVRALGRP